MKIVLERLKDDSESNIGTLSIDGVFKCFTLEDTNNFPKIKGKTCIPKGIYPVDLRTNSPKYEKLYGERYDFHKGMLWIRNIPDFSYVYIHTGNDEHDTDGCILLGKTCSTMIGNQRIAGSVLAYKDYYPEIANAVYRGEKVTIEIK